MTPIALMILRSFGENLPRGDGPPPGRGPYAAATLLLIASISLPLGTGAPWYVFFPLAFLALLSAVWGAFRTGLVATLRKLHREDGFLRSQVALGGGWRRYYRNAVFIRDYILEYVILASPDANSDVAPSRLLDVVSEQMKSEKFRLLLLRENEVFVRFALRMLCMWWARRGLRKGRLHLSKRRFPVVVPLHAGDATGATSLEAQVRSQILELVSGRRDHPLVTNFDDYASQGRLMLLVEIEAAPQPVLDQIVESFSKCPIVCVMSREEYVPDLPGPFNLMKEVKVLKRLSQSRIEQLLCKHLRGDGKAVFDYACKHSLVDQLGDPGFLVQMIESRKRKRSTSLDLFMQEQRLELMQLVQTAADRATTPEGASARRRSLARIAGCMRTADMYTLSESVLRDSGVTLVDIQGGVESGYLKRRSQDGTVQFTNTRYAKAFTVEAVLEKSRVGSLCDLAYDIERWGEMIARASVLSGDVMHALIACKGLLICALAMVCDMSSPASWSEAVGSEIGQALESDDIHWHKLEQEITSLKGLLRKSVLDWARFQSQMAAIRIRNDKARDNAIRFFSLLGARLGARGFLSALESSLQNAAIGPEVRLAAARGLFRSSRPSPNGSTVHGLSAYGFVSSLGFSIPAMVALGSEASARARLAPRHVASPFLEEAFHIVRSYSAECGTSVHICANLASGFFATAPDVDWRTATNVKALLLDIWYEGASAEAYQLVAQPLIAAFATAKKARGRLQDARLGLIQHFGGARAVTEALNLRRASKGD